MTAARITQVFDNALPLQAAGCAYRQNAFHIPGAPLALCAEAALTPQYSLTHNALGRIVGRLDLLILHKYPQMPLMFEDVTALAAQIALKTCTGLKQRFNTLLKFGHSALKRCPLQRAVADSLSQFQYFLCQIVKLTAYVAKRAFGLAYRLKITLQMRPAYLPTACKEIIAAPAVAAQRTAERIQQLFGRFLSAAGLNHKESRRLTAQCPQPAFETITSWPAGFIRMRRFLLSNMFGNFIVRLFHYLGQLSFTITQAAKAYRHREYLIDNGQSLTLAGIDIACEYPDYRQYTRTKMSSLDLIRQGPIDKRTAIPALAYMLDIFDDLRLYARYIDNLMAQRFLIGIFEICAAARAYVRFKMDILLYKLQRQKLSQVRLMAVSCSAFLMPMLRRFDHKHSGRIGRRRFGRILRVHTQKPFKFFDAFFHFVNTLLQLCVFFFQLLNIRIFVHKVIIGQRQLLTKLYFDRSQRVNAY
jgi:hypothetical protein